MSVEKSFNNDKLIIPNIEELSEWKKHDLIGWMGETGPMYSKADNNNWLYAIKMEEKHLNQGGAMHGGVISTLLDQAMSAVSWQVANKVPCVTVQLTTQYMKPVTKIGELVVAKAEVLSQSGSLIYMSGYVFSENKVVATGVAVMKIMYKSDKKV